ncbi:TRAP transporter permease [Desulfonatronovibrio magnus]|uniref:TRAP transporter permease n=1 Tax=Desulfonatronovibrio magnus TaxID=698827 RepID=UPI000A020A93|nr:TRAP transporter permease [Desulfonatronovibrio magnus]
MSDIKDLTEEQKQELEKIKAKESKFGRRLTPFWHVLVCVLGAAMVFFYLYSAGVQPFSDQYHRGVYVLLTYVMIFISFPFWSKSNMHRPTIVDIGLALTSIFVVGYWILEFENLAYRMGAETQMDIWVSIVGIVLSLEVSRRVLGWSITIGGLLFLVYGYFGPYMPGIIAHRGFDIERLATFLYLTQDGVFGVMCNVLVTYVIIFIFFGSFLQQSGVGRFFIDWPLALAGRSLGGPAKVSVVASGFFGSVSGSAIANTVSTGSFTIPLMKRAGFRPHVAGAIEPAASIGGMFMPPIMGAGGFLMAEMTNTPYVQIMAIAVFPALLYFISVFVMIHFEAKKQNIRGIVDENSPKAREVFKQHWFKAMPLVIIVAMMLFGYSPGMAAFWATISCVVISWVDKEYRMGPSQIWRAIVVGARNTLVIGATVGVIGIIVGTISLSGIGLKFSDLIISLSGGNLLIAMILIAFASLVLGMGVPVTASYLIVAVLAVPALHELGVSLIAAHMIVYWFSQNSNVTPPVCVAAYAGAAIAGSDPWRTGWTALKFSKLIYVVPFLFAYEPAMVLQGSVQEIAMVYFAATIGTIAFSAWSMFYLVRKTTLIEWIVFGVGTYLCFSPDIVKDIIGISLVTLVILNQYRKNKRDRQKLEALRTA